MPFTLLHRRCLYGLYGVQYSSVHYLLIAANLTPSLDKLVYMWLLLVVNTTPPCTSIHMYSERCGVDHKLTATVDSLRWRVTSVNDIHDLCQVAIFSSHGYSYRRSCCLQFACLSIGMEYSKFHQRSVSHRGATSSSCETKHDRL